MKENEFLGVFDTPLVTHELIMKYQMIFQMIQVLRMVFKNTEYNN